MDVFTLVASLFRGEKWIRRLWRLSKWKDGDFEKIWMHRKRISFISTIEFTYNKGDVKDMIIEKILCRIRCKWMARYITSRIRITYKKTTTIQRNLRNHRTMDECINCDSETENSKLC